VPADAQLDTEEAAGCHGYGREEEGVDTARTRRGLRKKIQCGRDDYLIMAAMTQAAGSPGPSPLPRGVKAFVLVDRSVYVAGAPITGRIDVRVQADWPVRLLSVSLRGIQRTHVIRPTRTPVPWALAHADACGRDGAGRQHRTAALP
jgi:hypothetical protein